MKVFTCSAGKGKQRSTFIRQKLCSTFTIWNCWTTACFTWLNSLPNCKSLDSSKFKAFADDKLITTQNLKFVHGRVEKEKMLVTIIFSFSHYVFHFLSRGVDSQDYVVKSLVNAGSVFERMEIIIGIDGYWHSLSHHVLKRPLLPGCDNKV